MDDEVKLALPKFLKIFANNGIPMQKAMVLAKHCYKDFALPSKLSEMTDVKLASLGVDDKDLRKQAISALKKGGYIGSTLRQPKAGSSQPPSTMTAVETLTTPTKKRKRAKASDVNEFLPTPKDETEDVGNLEFNEVLDEEVLQTKSTVVNRAPLLTAWATLVAEKLGFQREEALSIASVFTEMNAISKGIALGKFKKNAANGMEASTKGTQPYVDLMGRRCSSVSPYRYLTSARPLYQNQTSQWRGLSAGNAVPPSTAFAYISRALRQTAPHIIGAMRLLLDTYSVEEINAKGWGLYADFRPDVSGWGDRAEVRCSTILDLRQTQTVSQERQQPAVQTTGNLVDQLSEEPSPKRSRVMTLEEYEAALDEDRTFDNVNLDFDTQY
ncbi:Glutamine synthetase [Mycena indigotica]|uniref:Glutamine synthetase n=1 Tax=Mycena indigotica TaxID=2126181 RepID=A0A8H6W167_9AGAR|nr:Glutamine synthetase [Mycena indigotica]KAF7301739.1 Glutamine synthetase [Mycena indigotica]